jgi:DNA-binding beta-propeller fold protein YncE
MLTFTPNGGKLLVANEATPGHRRSGNRLKLRHLWCQRIYGRAPTARIRVTRLGSVSIIDMATRTVTATATLTGVDHQRRQHPRQRPEWTIEPEYIAVNAAGTKAYVTLAGSQRGRRARSVHQQLSAK